MDNLDIVLNDLTDEEKAILEKLQAKLLSSMSKNMDDNESVLDKMAVECIDSQDIIHPKNLSKSPNEIIFCVRAEATKLDSHGQVSEVVDIVETFYHIPVSLDDNYEIFIRDFMNKFHTNLEDSCKIISKYGNINSEQ